MGAGEASESSDLDVVVVLDRLGMPELRKYENAIHALPHRGDRSAALYAGCGSF